MLCQLFASLCFLLVVSLVKHNDVLIYSDLGTSLDLIDAIEQSLKSLTSQSFRRVQAKDLSQPNWEPECSLLIIPGGRDIFYTKSLTSSIITRIRNYINSGGSYLGICAGAYFGSSFVNFERGRPCAVIGSRELALFPGTAHGSAIRPFSYEFKKSNPTANVLMTGWKNPVYASFYFLGGCYFIPSEVHKYGWHILATYAIDGTAAIIEGKVGAGRVILSGPHIEVDHTMMKGLEDTWMYKELKMRPVRRKRAFKYIIKKLVRSKNIKQIKNQALMNPIEHLHKDN